MKTPNLSSFTYREKTEGALRAFERIRLQERARLWGRVRLIVGGALAIVSFLALRLPMLKHAIWGGEEDYVTDPNEVFILVAIAMVIGWAVAGSVLLCVFSRRSFVKKAKTKVIQPLVLEVFPDLLYEPQGKVPQPVFEASGLFSRNYNFYEGEDYFQGLVGDRVVEFSELQAGNRSSSDDDSGSGRSSDLFSGLFMRVTLNKSFSQRIVIDANRIDALLQQHKIPGFVENLIRRMTPDYGPQIKTGDESFDRDFKVFASDKETVLSLLTPEFVDRLVRIRESLDRGNGSAMDASQQLATPFLMKVAIEGNALYFALHQKSLFEFAAYRSVQDSQDLITGSLERISMMIDLASVC